MPMVQRLVPRFRSQIFGEVLLSGLELVFPALRISHCSPASHATVVFGHGFVRLGDPSQRPACCAAGHHGHQNQEIREGERYLPNLACQPKPDGDIKGRRVIIAMLLAANSQPGQWNHRCETESHEGWNLTISGRNDGSEQLHSVLI